MYAHCATCHQFMVLLYQNVFERKVMSSYQGTITIVVNKKIELKCIFKIPFLKYVALLPLPLPQHCPFSHYFLLCVNFLSRLYSVHTNVKY